MCTDKEEKKIFLIYSIMKFRLEQSYKRKGFLMYEEMSKYSTRFEEAVSLLYDFATAPL